MQRVHGRQHRSGFRRHQIFQCGAAIAHDVGGAQRNMEQIAQGLVGHHGCARKVLHQHAARKMPDDFQQMGACGGQGLFGLAPLGGVHQRPDQVAAGLLGVQQVAANREPAQRVRCGGHLVFQLHSPGATHFVRRLAKVTEGGVVTADHAHALPLERQPIHGEIFVRPPVAQFNRVVGRGDQQRCCRVVEHGTVQLGVGSALADIGLCADDQRACTFGCRGRLATDFHPAPLVVCRAQTHFHVERRALGNLPLQHLGQGPAVVGVCQLLPGLKWQGARLRRVTQHLAAAGVWRDESAGSVPLPQTILHGCYRQAQPFFTVAQR